MAKAVFHKSQRVYVKPVGTYALVERVVPHWVKGVEEPLRIVYDCGLGRDFKARELVSEKELRGGPSQKSSEFSPYQQWRLERRQNRQIVPEDSSHHPYPGTYPVVQTDEADWGGWRVPGAEYNRDPERIEYQARIIANSPDMLRICKAIVKLAETTKEPSSESMVEIAKKARAVLSHVYDQAGERTQSTIAAE